MTKDKGPDDYEVGYKKPPIATRFPKGRSGNPNGKKPMTRNMNTIVHETLFAPIEIKQNGKTMLVPAIEAIVLKMRNNGLAGDYRSGVHAIQLASQASGIAEADRTRTRDIDLDPQVIADMMREYLDYKAPVASENSAGASKPDGTTGEDEGSE